MTLIGAIVLLAALVLNVNQAILHSSDNSYESEAILTATNVAQGLLDEITSKEFDEKCVNTYVEEASGFTAPDSLGFESGESYPNFDDIDDFDNYTRTDATSRMGNFDSVVDVCYVDPAAPDTEVNYKSHTKRITVSVTSDYLIGTLRLNYYLSY